MDNTRIEYIVTLPDSYKVIVVLAYIMRRTRIDEFYRVYCDVFEKFAKITPPAYYMFVSQVKTLSQWGILVLKKHQGFLIVELPKDMAKLIGNAISGNKTFEEIFRIAKEVVGEQQ